MAMMVMTDDPWSLASWVSPATEIRNSWKRLGAGGTGDGDVPITHSIRSCSNAALAIARLYTA